MFFWSCIKDKQLIWRIFHICLCRYIYIWWKCLLFRGAHTYTHRGYCCCMDTVPQQIHGDTVWIWSILFSAKAVKVFAFLYLRSLFPKTDENIPKMNKPKPAWLISLQLHNKQTLFFFFFLKSKDCAGYFTETTLTTAWFIFLVVRNEIKKKTGYGQSRDNPSFYEFTVYTVTSLIQSFHKTPVSIKPLVSSFCLLSI